MWQQRAVAYEAAEAARLVGLAQWLAVGPRPGVGRVDVVGGNPWGWQGLLTVAGAGYLATHGPSTIVDLTGDGLCRDLYEVCVQSGVTVDVQVPPGDSDLLSGLDPRQLVDVLVESVHGDGDHAVRADRAADDRILTAVVEALGEDVTLERITDGLRVLMAAPGDTPSLTTAERARIADDLFTADYLKQAAVALHRLESYLFPLRGLSATARPQAALTVVATAADGTSARSELLNDVIVAWLTRRIGTDPDICRILVVAGADYLPARHVQRLGDVCARRGVALVLLWRHLRDSALRALGSGTVAFMRLGSAEEAVHAADYIGREHRFVLSGLTHTVGGSQTQTEATSYSDATSTGTSRGVTSGGHMTGLIHAARAWSRAESSTTGVTRTASTSSSTATGTSLSDASSTQRVYEYAVEPTVLQGLPEYALLLVEHTPAGSTVRALDCNPAIVTLPSVDMNTTTATSAAPTRGAVGYTPPVVPPATGASRLSRSSVPNAPPTGTATPTATGGPGEHHRPGRTPGRALVRTPACPRHPPVPGQHSGPRPQRRRARAPHPGDRCRVSRRLPYPGAVPVRLDPPRCGWPGHGPHHHTFGRIRLDRQGLRYPPGASGVAVDQATVAGLLTGFAAWTRIALTLDPLITSGRSGHPSQVDGLEDLLLDGWPRPFAWLVYAEPVAPEQVADAAELAAEAERDARTRANSPTHLVRADRLAARHRELRAGESTGVWRTHLLAGGADERSALAFAGLLAAAHDLNPFGYALVPSGLAGPLDQVLRAAHEDTPTGATSPIDAGSPLLAAIACPPAAEIPGVQVRPRSTFDVTPPENPVGGVPVGQIVDRSGHPAGTLELARQSLVRHTFVTGATGSGKSTTVQHLLTEASRAGLAVAGDRTRQSRVPHAHAGRRDRGAGG